MLMHGVVSLLDQAHYEKVESLWRELRQRFGVGSPKVVHFPHFSYHIAESYDEARLNAVLAAAAREIRPFTLNAAGIALFPGPESVLYIPVSRSPALTQLHATLWPQLEAISVASSPYYTPDSWFPHITLAQGDVTRDNLGPICRWLQQQNIAWSFTVDNFCLIRETDHGHELTYRVSFP